MFLFFWPRGMWESYVPNRGLNPGLPVLEDKILTTGLPGKSLTFYKFGNLLRKKEG